MTPYALVEPALALRLREGVVTADVLVVDDDPTIRQIVRLILNDEGYAVRVAANGREALARVAEGLPALVLLDLNMPVMSGWHAYAELRVRQPGLPVVFMTAGQRASEEAARWNADGYLAKPFEYDELVTIVQRFTRPPAA